MTAAPPAADALELTVIGPGYGECVLVHLGLGEWLVVDSCRAHGRHRAAALEYLESLGVDASNAVRLLLISHWHDDHIRGAAELVSSCPAARVFCSTAMHDSEIPLLAGAAIHQGTLSTSGVSEFGGVLAAISETGTRTLERAVEDRHLYSRAGTSPQADVWALSPSSGAVNDAVAAMSNLSTLVSENLKVSPLAPNDASVAVSVKVGELEVLLGADLERGPADGRKGWEAALRTYAASSLSASVVKVPHHGSAGAHHDGMWSTLLIPQPTSVVSPYTRLRDALPTPADQSRIHGLSATAYLTASPRRPRSRLERTVEKTITESVKYMEAAEPMMGRVTLRSSAFGVPSWFVELSASATAF